MDNQPKVIIQRASKTTQIPTNAMIKNWVNLALNSSPKNVEISIKIVDPEESASLNKQYRQKKGATNVLSFPMSVKTEDLDFLGDLVICAQIVKNEAIQQGKSVEAHWAHIIIHGILHLLGHTHDQEESMRKMEALEVNLLSQINICNPYIKNKSESKYE
ncbi:MAG: rRNA maturation RNase YbeY [Pseudomonadota bacterium]|nr:rRNA maturation RNase YbeY [Pseudomonadota bacterium]